VHAPRQLAPEPIGHHLYQQQQQQAEHATEHTGYAVLVP
jgi:hypothetical protein